ncbi:MAG TPA: hypothetical protein VN176_08365 [Verrucomicrobiae bacterium]|nr:hypothetical protein [Verrucomicrobiae bacterium]
MQKKDALIQRDKQNFKNGSGLFLSGSRIYSVENILARERHASQMERQEKVRQEVCPARRTRQSLSQRPAFFC